MRSTDNSLKIESIHKIFSEVISATATMTSIPKPMKFLVPLYPILVEEYKVTAEGNTKVVIPDPAILLGPPSAAIWDSCRPIRAGLVQVPQTRHWWRFPAMGPRVPAAVGR